jgi:hypothetical protein
VIIEASSLDFIMDCVKQNKGVSFMIEPDIKKEFEEEILRIIPIDEGNISLLENGGGVKGRNEKGVQSPICFTKCPHTSLKLYRPK